MFWFADDIFSTNLVEEDIHLKGAGGGQAHDIMIQRSVEINLDELNKLTRVHLPVVLMYFNSIVKAALRQQKFE